jgi:alpha-L-arabinofuranosidase
MLKRVIFLHFLIVLLLPNFNSQIASGAASENPGAAVLLVDTDFVMGNINEGIYGQFLEHINHSVIDGLYAEQVRGQGFEGTDFQTYWESFSNNGDLPRLAAGTAGVRIENVKFENGEKSIRLNTSNGTAGIRQKRIYFQNGFEYNGSVWLKPEQGSVNVTFCAKDSSGNIIAEVPLKTNGTQWQEVNYSFSSTKTDTQGVIEIAAIGSGSVLVDFISMMRADVRKSGMFRPDLFKALSDLKPSFIRWPGGSFASTYLWKDGIGPRVSRRYHPNVMWGGYYDYYGFGTDEFLELCRQLGSEPLIVLAAPSTEPNKVQYAMDWVHYLYDQPTTEMGKLRAANGHREPYKVKYIQIDNEPMNNGFNSQTYAEIVNVYGSEIRKIAPDVKIVACGQKRSNDMEWSQRVIDTAGDNFDILGCHNYEYENENFQTGVTRIYDYLVKLREYVRVSKHPSIKIAVLEWSLCRTYDWRSGLHTAGSLIAYEKLGPELEMTCPALLMRNTTDNPEWRAFIYHDHVSWFPGSGYVVEKLFREHYAQKYLASATGTFSDIPARNTFFDDIPQMKPEDWKPGTFDAIATGSEDGKRIVIKAVNYEGIRNTLLARLQGKNVFENADVTIYSLNAGLTDAPSLENPDKIKPEVKTIPYLRDLTVVLEPYAVVVIEITSK